MKLSIINDDSMVIVNGTAIQMDEPLSLTSNIHAVQWEKDKGHIEFKDDAPNKEIDSLDFVSGILDMHAKKNQAIEEQKQVERVKQEKLKEKNPIRAEAKKKITDLENSITPRRLAQAILSVPGKTWLEGVELLILEQEELIKGQGEQGG